MTRPPPTDAEFDDALTALAGAHQNQLLSATATANARVWLTQPHYADLAPLVADHVRDNQWQTLEDVFWTQIPFGTAGRRGRMYPIGCNAINDRTVGETVQALADYVREIYRGPKPPATAIAYDTRHHSREFAELSAEIMAASGFRVYFFDGIRATPVLSSTVRYLQCACGIMISASHNPPTDNALKLLWAGGGQIKPPHDQEVTRLLSRVTHIDRVPFAAAVQQRHIVFCQPNIDTTYRDAVLAEGFHRARGRRNLHVLFSPLHGVGLTSVQPVLEADGFDVSVFEPHATPDGDFPNIPHHIPNPENPEVFADLTKHAQAIGAELVLASDPDADRIGCAAPRKLGDEHWQTFSGNQIGVLLAAYILNKRSQAGTLLPDHYLISTLVTTDMLRRLTTAYGVKLYSDILTGFKWIGEKIDDVGPAKFLLGVEEAHGYLAGTYTRDKDGAVAGMLLAEAAAEAKAEGHTLHQELERLFQTHGCFWEKTVAVTLTGAQGQQQMQHIMSTLRETPPKEIEGLAVVRTRDYLRNTIVHADGSQTPLAGPVGNVLVLETELDGTYLAVRPSGTEPKIKFYFFTNAQPSQSQDVPAIKAMLQQRLNKISQDVLARFELADPGTLTSSC